MPHDVILGLDNMFKVCQSEQNITKHNIFLPKVHTHRLKLIKADHFCSMKSRFGFRSPSNSTVATGLVLVYTFVLNDVITTDTTDPEPTTHPPTCVRLSVIVCYCL